MMRTWPVALLFTAAGVLHFVLTEKYVRVVPPYLPWARVLVLISGAAEIVGGLGILFAPVRRMAAWGLIALLVAVFPANVYMAQAHLMGPDLLLWARLPLQVLLIWWVWWAAKA